MEDELQSKDGKKLRLVYRTFVILFLFCNSVKSEQENLT